MIILTLLATVAVGMQHDNGRPLPIRQGAPVVRIERQSPRSRMNPRSGAISRLCTAWSVLNNRRWRVSKPGARAVSTGLARPRRPRRRSQGTFALAAEGSLIREVVGVHGPAVQGEVEVADDADGKGADKAATHGDLRTLRDAEEELLRIEVLEEELGGVDLAVVGDDLRQHLVLGD